MGVCGLRCVCARTWVARRGELGKVNRSKAVDIERSPQVMELDFVELQLELIRDKRLELVAID